MATQSQLISKSVYAFDLDKKSLNILDADMFIANKDILCKDSFIIKTINPSAVTNRAYIHIIDHPCPSILDIIQTGEKPVSEKIACITVESGKVILNIKKPVNVKNGTTVLFRLDHTLPLEGENPDLFFCGSVQPSDYLNLRSHLNLEGIRKEVVLNPFSRKQFKAWIFDASNPQAYSAPKISNLDRVQCLSHTLNIKLTDWERAKYFGIFIQ